MTINYSVDYYEVVGVGENTSKNDLKKKILRVVTDLDIEVRTTIPQRIQREAKEELRKELGREPKTHEENQYLLEKTQDPDPSKRDKEYVEKTIKLRLANEARETLLNNNKKNQYDTSHNQTRQVTCYDHSSKGGKERTKWFNRSDPKGKKWNSCYFCSLLCFNEHLKISGRGKAPKKGPNTGNAPCYKCNTKQATDWKRRKNGRWYCGDCWNLVPNCSWCKSKKGWFKEKGGTGNERFCSQPCLSSWVAEKENRNGPPKPKTKPQYFTELTSLVGWELLTENEKDKFKEMIKNGRLEADWKKVIGKAKDFIKQRKEENGDDEEEDNGDDNNLAVEIQKVIQEIENELNREPKISFYDNWIDVIQRCSSLDELKTWKEKIFGWIQALRKKQGGGGENQDLTEFQNYTIHQINQELAKNPPVSSSQLENPHWETEIKQAQKKDDIISIREKVLVDIKTKRAAQQISNKVVELLEQAKTTNTFETLGLIITELQNYRSSKAYQQHQDQIEALEIRLQKLNPTLYQEQIKTDLEQQVQSQGLTYSELDTDTQKAIEQANRTGQPTDKNLAGEKISYCGAQVNLNKLITKAFSVLTTKTKLEKLEMAKELELFINKDSYKKKAYQNQKDKVDQLLEQLRGRLGQKKPGALKKTWPKTLGIITLIVIPLFVLVGVIITLRRKNLRQKG